MDGKKNINESSINMICHFVCVSNQSGLWVFDLFCRDLDFHLSILCVCVCALCCDDIFDHWIELYTNVVFHIYQQFRLPPICYYSQTILFDHWSSRDSSFWRFCRDTSCNCSVFRLLLLFFDVNT